MDSCVPCDKTPASKRPKGRPRRYYSLLLFLFCSGRTFPTNERRRRSRSRRGLHSSPPFSSPFTPICVNTVRDSPIPLQYFADSANFFPPFLADASLEGKQKVSFLILHGCEFSFQDRGPRGVTRDEIGGERRRRRGGGGGGRNRLSRT